ncbi:CRISPR-associated protein Cmr2 [Desulfobotulus alkaliphilus]|uniref:CRISPR-associated protein Cmr2 n=1 Tax=Desulfobotulus alkaliphilus TaxID=622671 RepID=A0A562R2Q4_9BACT|nr:type III-B CRISPR-associated protein Cas10/Cmr2 [Desulfobotulus alkaliphilus]TWI62864.1 CRISPR-associated protein Cmr2 [Desulfobotulus alkaliphilus]
MKESLLVIAIGPVQEFIATARKLRDLWIGSMLLSELSKTIARSLHEDGAKLIFPSLAPGQEAVDLAALSDLNVANKILVKVSSPEEAKRIQQRAKEKWQAHLDEIGEKTLEKMDSLPFVRLDRERFQKQMKDYGEFYAAWVEIEAAGGYASARDRVEGLLASRKNVRPFGPPMWEGSGVPKNSLDGMRETVLGEKLKEIKGLLKKNERLDAMGCIKRFYPLAIKKQVNEHFDDLSDIALIPWLEGIEGNMKKLEAFIAFQSAVQGTNNGRYSEKKQATGLSQNLESDLYYAGRDALKNHLGEESSIREAWKTRNKMVKVCGEPHLYAVILVGDGDNMGKMIDAIKTQEGHARFTSELSTFAKEVKGLVEGYSGSLIYSGGDDVMAYLPLHKALACADKLRLKFHDSMAAVHKELNLPESVVKPTFSAGLAIVHHSMPLDQALDQARKAEKMAKNGGRNALAIVQNKRSGGELSIVGKWDRVDNKPDLPGMAERMGAVVDLYNDPETVLPARLGYQLREASLSAGDQMNFATQAGEKVVPNNAAAALIKRIFDQKNDGNREKNKKLIPLLSGRVSIREFSDELVIGHQIARAVRLAEGKETP